MANPTSELRYHITVFDESGAILNINNMERVDLDDFNNTHQTDDLDYMVEYDRMRPTRFGTTARAR